MQQVDFAATVSDYFTRHGRHDLPWRQPDARGDFDPYAITVSELMLQQTQVSRVISKYQAFLRQFPGVADLAAAPLAEVLQAWSGLGYNRRAKFLWQAAQQVTDKFGGHFPMTTEELVALPGIGRNTAGAILAYAFDQPAVFVETNVRTVYIHHFFQDAETVADAQIIPLVHDSLIAVAALGSAGCTPRTWYWAVMDYGVHLKQTAGNASRRSATYVKQSPFAGSRRQIRGQVLAHLRTKPATVDELHSTIKDERLISILADLQQEAMITCQADYYHLGS